MERLNHLSILQNYKKQDGLFWVYIEFNPITISKHDKFNNTFKSIVTFYAWGFIIINLKK